MRRRSFMAGVAAAGLLRPRPVRADAAPTLLDAARRLAARPFDDASPPLPPPFAGLSYDAYRGIRPIPGRAAMLDHGAEFRVDLLPPGLFFPDPVRIDRDTGNGPQEIAFAPDLFAFDDRYFGTIPQTAPGAGFSGLRVRHPLNAADRMDELLVMQGASYFRAIGQAMVYGLSARTVALGTGRPGPEEFPRFTHLRLHPARGATLRIEGVIDSPSLAGHLDMTLRPGQDTVTDMAVTLFPRREIADIGVAPLTSMYLKGPLRASVSDDFRPRVHDSDLLLIENGAGERIWRPISNPARVEASAFLDDGPVSFGLYQTRRDFADFEDTEARYHDRPSAVVRPSGAWGRGAVILVEIPTGDEFMDNVVAFWRPETPLAAGSVHRFSYSIAWTRTAPSAHPGRAILQSRSGREHDRPGARRYVIDISGQPGSLAPEITSQGPVQIDGISLFALPGGQDTRLTFLLTPGMAEVADIRIVLRDDGGRTPPPVWVHRWTRARDGGV
ncbi:Glucans biosynthesis protein G precursor [Roseibacterium elongatum DSM 19469]|uniref:Glucans biosynthesis protein G n=1 Tax=Roseicyclus elongatus DSM 19469 TaxID=1294273 RepID=W8RPC7_9RHOB|nr:glucan biosynthesis protein [Roseibacterium elongatum]AHM02994.1 Glucans biosynthesis protein G precursor [Roseibacterium elongatum DSM 19469]